MSKDFEKSPMGDKVFLYAMLFLIPTALVACLWAVWMSPAFLIILMPFAMVGIGKTGLIQKAWLWVFRPLKRLRRLSHGQGILLILVITAALVLLAPFSMFMTKHCFIIDPFLDLRGFALYLGVLGVGGSVILLANAGWQALERAKVRSAILRELRLPPGAEGCRLAREQTLALVRCTGCRLQGKLAGLGGRRLWLCFLHRRLLVISGRTGAVVALSAEELRKIDLLDHGTGTDFRLTIRSGEDRSLIKLNRLDNVARVVNVLIQRGVVLGFQSARRWNVRAISAAAVLAILAAAVTVIGLHPSFLTDLSRARKETWRCTQTFPLGFNGDRAVFSPNGKLLAMPEGPGLSIWSTTLDQAHPRPTRLRIAEFPDLTPEFRASAFSPDGTRLVFPAKRPDDTTSTTPYNIILWDFSNERVDRTLTSKDVRTVSSTVGTYYGFHGELVFSPDGKQLGCASGGSIKIWDLAGGKEVVNLSHPAVHSMAFSPDGKWLATVGGDKDGIKIWDLKRGQEERILPGDRGPIARIIFSPDGRYLAASQKSETVSVWTWPEGRQEFFLSGGGGSRLVFSPDGRWLAASNGAMWDLSVKPWEVSPDWRSKNLIEESFSENGELKSLGFLTEAMSELKSLQAYRAAKSVDELKAVEPKAVEFEELAKDPSLELGQTRPDGEPKQVYVVTELKGLQFSHDGKRLLAVVNDRVIVWERLPPGGRQ